MSGYSGTDLGKYWGGGSPLNTVHTTSSTLSLFSFTLFTCKFLPGLILCNLLALFPFLTLGTPSLKFKKEKDGNEAGQQGSQMALLLD